MKFIKNIQWKSHPKFPVRKFNKRNMLVLLCMSCQFLEIFFNKHTRIPFCTSLDLFIANVLVSAENSLSHEYAVEAWSSFETMDILNPRYAQILGVVPVSTEIFTGVNVLLKIRIRLQTPAVDFCDTLWSPDHSLKNPWFRTIAANGERGSKESLLKLMTKR